MLEFKPFDIDDDTHGYRAFENGEIIGESIFRINSAWVDILSVKAANDDLLVAEGLIRSSLNFAANRGVYMARANAGSAVSQPFETLGFSKDGDDYISDIPSALTGSCKDCGK
ncbi:MAG: hypothetical protein ACI4I0_06330 [Acutalibacteraceae bacterium]